LGCAHSRERIGKSPGPLSGWKTRQKELVSDWQCKTGMIDWGSGLAHEDEEQGRGGYAVADDSAGVASLFAGRASPIPQRRLPV